MSLYEDFHKSSQINPPILQVDVFNEDPGAKLGSMRLAQRRIREAQTRLLDSTKKRDGETSKSGSSSTSSSNGLVQC